jgi:hypothetical protein
MSDSAFPRCIFLLWPKPRPLMLEFARPASGASGVFVGAAVG